MDRIFIILKVTEYYCSSYEYSPGSGNWGMRGSHYVDDKTIEFHSAYPTEQEANEALENLKLSYESKHGSHQDGDSWTTGYECSGFLIRELSSGQEIGCML